MATTLADRFFQNYIDNHVKVIKKRKLEAEKTTEVNQPEIEEQQVEEPVVAEQEVEETVSEEILTSRDLYVVTRPTINLRALPDKSGEVIKKLHKGYEFCIVDEQDGWVEVFGGGFIPTNSIKKVEE